MRRGKQQPSKELGRAVSASRAIFTGLLFFSFFISVLMLTGPLYMLQVYDRVLSSNSVPTLIALTVLVAVLYLTLSVLDFVRQAIFAEAGSKFEDLLGKRAMEAAIAANLKDPGRETEKPIRDLRTLRKFYSSPALATLFDAPYAPLFFFVIYMLHWSYGVWATFGAIVLVIVALINQRTSSNLLLESERLEREATLKAGEMARNVEVMETMGMRERLETRWRDLFDRSDKAITRSSQRLGAFSAGTKAFRLFLQSAILGIGAYLSIQQISTPGAMIAASILMGRAIAPIEQLVGQWRVITSAGEAWGSLKGYLEKAPPAPETMQLPPIRGEVSVENVFAAPPRLDKPILRGLSFRLEPGDCIGIIGPSAAGKSTLARILSGVWPVLTGTVRIDGSDVRNWPRGELGPQIGYMPQQVDLFSGSVRENIARFDPDAPADAVIRAAEAAACDDLIRRLPNGYDTEIGQGGAYLSAGQRQRVGLARALYGDPMFVILDEPNSNLDQKGDDALQKAILGLRERGATVIVIAHRPNAIVNCNKLMILDGGEIKALGPRDEILAKLAQNAKARGASVTPIRKATTTTDG